MIGLRNILKLAAIAVATAGLPVPIHADVLNTPPVDVSGWDEAAGMPIWHRRGPGPAVFYALSAEQERKLSTSIFRAATRAGFGARLPDSDLAFHESRLLTEEQNRQREALERQKEQNSNPDFGLRYKF